jgi:hypothetical protein
MIILFRQYCKYWGGKTYLKLIFKNGINCKKFYTNLNIKSHYLCLFFINPERTSFYVRSICTFFWTRLFTVHHCSRKITSLWNLTLLISLSYINVWRYFRSCITKTSVYFVTRVSFCMDSPEYSSLKELFTSIRTYKKAPHLSWVTEFVEIKSFITKFTSYVFITLLTGIVSWNSSGQLATFTSNGHEKKLKVTSCSLKSWNRELNSCRRTWVVVTRYLASVGLSCCQLLYFIVFVFSVSEIRSLAALQR